MAAILGSGHGLAAGTSITAKEASQYFQQADALTRADGGRLWGISLGGGLLLADPETRVAYANQPDPQGRLMRVGPVLRGEISTDVNLANTALDWAGARWSMILVPLPEDRFVRATLIAHELWHRVQDRLGLPSSAATNNHLDTRDGRYWLQLEWRALAAALAAQGPDRARAMTDAVLFRAQRRALFPQAAGQENGMEMHEGLAEYTGVRLSGAPDPARFVIDHELKDAPQKESFVRSFAYANGPAYGLLLDDTGSDWRKEVSPETDMGALLLRRHGLTLPADLQGTATRRAPAYGATSLAAQEDARAEVRRKVNQDYRARLVEGPLVKLPLRNMKIEFDPGNLVPLESLGTVYPHLRVVDDWGVLSVTEHGALISADFTQVALPGPATVASESITGEGWKLELKPGWSADPGPRKGDLQLRRAPGR
ncbi:MAG: hypothetical protein ABI540_08615 [Spartobacteria bacterium]